MVHTYRNATIYSDILLLLNFITGAILAQCLTAALISTFVGLVRHFCIKCRENRIFKKSSYVSACACQECGKVFDLFLEDKPRKLTVE